jgi:hypothetical protein
VNRSATAVLIVTLAAACSGAPQDGVVTVTRPVVGETPAGQDAAVYFQVESGGRDAIVGATAPGADSVSLHELRPVEGGGIMLPSDTITVDPGLTRLSPMGSHLMLSSVREPLVAGDRIPLTIEFDRHAPIAIEVTVVPLHELAELIERAP